MIVKEQPFQEVMEELGQTNIFEFIEGDKELVPIGVGDKVRCIITPESDEMAYNYFKYNYPQVLTGVGEVVAIQGRTLHVRYKNDVVLLNPEEVSV